MRKDEAKQILSEYPIVIAHAVGFDRMGSLHNQWIKEMVFCESDKTLQSHRGSYKTTCITIALAELMLANPAANIMFLRKTDGDVKEVIRQVAKIVKTPMMQAVSLAYWGVPMELTSASATELTTNLYCSARGTSQLVGAGINGSLTGKHFDYIFTDDIVNAQDRVSKAERDHTKLVYQELQNIRNVGGRIFNTGTPWHKDDCFTIMPSPEQYPPSKTGMLDAQKLDELRQSMTPSLFAANYELKHIADDDVIFTTPQTGAEPFLVEQGIGHIDAAYGGEDFTAYTICRKVEGKYYLLGKLWHKHVDDCTGEIMQLHAQFNAGKLYCEDNGDKGYLAKQLKRLGLRTSTYHENMNKHIKITSYLKAAWKDVVFVAGADEEYINQICDYNENAEHDDAPDSAASVVRKLWKGKQATGNYNGL